MKGKIYLIIKSLRLFDAHVTLFLTLGDQVFVKYIFGKGKGGEGRGLLLELPVYIRGDSLQTRLIN